MTRRLLLVLGIALAVLVSATGTASAAFVAKTATTPQSVSSGVLAAPTGVTASVAPTNCRSILTNYTVTARWTPTTQLTRAVSGYSIAVTSGGQTTRYTVSDVATASWTSPRMNTGLSGAGYSASIVVSTITPNLWSAPAASVSVSC